MKGIVKAIIAGAIIIGVGLGVIVLASALNGWNVTGVSFETKTYESVNIVENLDIDFATGTMEISYYEGETVKVEYPYFDEMNTEISTAGTTLRISNNKLRWNSFRLWFVKIPTTKVYIPQDWQINLDLVVNAGTVRVAEGSYGKVDVELNAGSVHMEDLVTSDCKIEVNAGSLNVSGIDCTKFSGIVSAGSLHVSQLQSDQIKVNVSAGSANVVVLGDKADYTINANVSAGSCNVRSQVGKEDPNKHITVNVSAGSATIKFDYAVPHNN